MQAEPKNRLERLKQWKRKPAQEISDRERVLRAVLKRHGAEWGQGRAIR